MALLTLGRVEGSKKFFRAVVKYPVSKNMPKIFCSGENFAEVSGLEGESLKELWYYVFFAEIQVLDNFR